MNKSTAFLLSTTMFSVGVIFGFLLSPIKQGLNVGNNSGNNSGNVCCEKPEDEEDIFES